jgi:hypothetical protein
MRGKRPRTSPVTNKGPRTVYRNLIGESGQAPSACAGPGLGGALYAARLGCAHTARRTENEDTIHGTYNGKPPSTGR